MKNMKKTISLLLAAVLCLSFATTASAAEVKTAQQTESDLVRYLEDHKVTSRDAFIKAVTEYGGSAAADSLKSGQEDFADYKGKDCCEKFSYTIDRKNQLILTETTMKRDVCDNSALKATYLTTASTQYDAYSWCGIRIFSVSVDGSFTRQPGSYCTVRTSHGAFRPAFLSLWTADSRVGTGNYNSTTAYIETYGTATLNMTIANLLGLVLNLQSLNYCLTLKCDSYGNVSAGYSQY